MHNFEKLEIWKSSINLAAKIYKITENFPKHEKYGLISQIQRSAVSVSSNIAEGSTRQYKKEFINFLYISRGSISELISQLTIANKINYLNKEDYENLYKEINTISKQINSMIKSLKINDKLR